MHFFALLMREMSYFMFQALKHMSQARKHMSQARKYMFQARKHKIVISHVRRQVPTRLIAMGGGEVSIIRKLNFFVILTCNSRLLVNFAGGFLKSFNIQQ